MKRPITDSAVAPHVPVGKAWDEVLVAAIGIDGEGVKHPLGLIEGAIEHGAVVQALIDDLVERGLDPAIPRLFIIDGSPAERNHERP